MIKLIVCETTTFKFLKKPHLCVKGINYSSYEKFERDFRMRRTATKQILYYLQHEQLN